MGTPKKQPYLFFQVLSNHLDLNSGKFINIYKIAFEDKTLFTAYYEILKNNNYLRWQKKNKLSGSISINITKLKKVAKKLKSLKYKISVPRKILIRKTIESNYLLLTSMLT